MRHPFLRSRLPLAALLTLVAGPAAHAQGTGFTYNGGLIFSNAPVNGAYDLRFTLYNAATNGAALGAVTNGATPITNGLYTVSLDFGPVFTGANFWIELAARTNNGGAFATLSPRQAILAAPYAMYATLANGFAGTLAGDVTGPQGATVTSRVGGQPAAQVAAATAGFLAATNTATPSVLVKRDATGGLAAGQITATALQVNGTAAATAFSGGGSGLTSLNASQLTSGTLPAARLPANVITNGASGASLTGVALLNGGNSLAGTQVISGGNVGIGTPTPQHTLEVSGNVWLGTGQEGVSFAEIGDSLYLGSPRKYISNTLGQNFNGSTDWLNLMFHPGSSGLMFGTSGPSDADPHSVPNPLMVITPGGNVGIGTTSPSTSLQVNGTISAMAFTGNGSALTGLNASQLTSGTVPLAQLPANVITNGSSGTSLSGVALLNGGNNLSGQQIILGNVGVGIAAPATALHVNGTVTASAFSGNGAALTGLNAAQVTSGTIPSAQLPPNVITNGSSGTSLTGVALLNSGNTFSTQQIFAGNVGIGTPTPTTALQVNGTVTASAFSGNGAALTGLNASQVTTGTLSPAQLPGNVVTTGSSGTSLSGVALLNSVNTFNANQLLNGSLGIGAAPGALLTLANNANPSLQVLLPSSTSELDLGMASANGAWSTFASAGDTVMRSTKNNLILQSGSGAGAIFINTANNVGIGVTAPTQARLVVGASTTTQSGYLWNGAAASTAYGLLYSYQAGAGGSVSVQANSWICSSTGFMTDSDRRIKTVVGRSDGSADLRQLRAIEVTDYTYKDVIAKGTNISKKVIAQQVESVYPQAVSRTTDTVPDIYQPAKFADGWVQLATDLQVGERVRLIGKDQDGVYAVEAIRDGAFRTAFTPATEDVFVFGREVNDFRKVDYDAIAMLNVSATQELARQLEAKQAQIDRLQAKCDRVDALEARVAELAALVKALTETK